MLQRLSEKHQDLLNNPQVLLPRIQLDRSSWNCLTGVGMDMKETAFSCGGQRLGSSPLQGCEDWISKTN